MSQCPVDFYDETTKVFVKFQIQILVKKYLNTCQILKFQKYLNTNTKYQKSLTLRLYGYRGYACDHRLR